MHGDNQDTSARVRHVPIHVESRHKSNSNKKTMQQGGESQHYSQREQEPGKGPDKHFNNDRSSPSSSSHTSFVNINHKPSPPKRPSPDRSSANQSDTSGNTCEQQPQQETDVDRASQEPKLANSREPIPMPPPTDETSANNHNNCQQQQQQSQTPDNNHKEIGALGQINSIKVDLSNLIQDIINFGGVSTKAKEYRYLDEMLTRCVLKLDNIECGGSEELRQQRRATVKLVDTATDILQRKLQINSDISDLNVAMSPTQNH